MSYTIKEQVRSGLPQVGNGPYNQVHAHSTGNPSSTVQNEADYMNSKDINSGFYTHVVGNGKVIHVGKVGRGAWDVGNRFNNNTYAAVELIESHKTQEEFNKDYKIYVELLIDLAKQGGITQTLDTASTAGIKTHRWTTDTTNTYGGHIDPYPYLAKWGISKAQFKKDIENGKATSPKPSAKPSKPATSKPSPKPTYKEENFSTKQITDTGLNIRKEPNTKSSIVGTLAKGFVFTPTKIVKNGESVEGYTTWCKYSNGWVSMAYTTPYKTTSKPKPTPKPTLKGSNLPNSGSYKVPAGMNIRSGAGTGYSIVGSYSKGETFNYDKKVTANGYVWLSYVSYSGERRYVAVV